MPFQINYILGGVARNVAECMSKLGSNPFMISVVGHDMAGSSLILYRFVFVRLLWHVTF